MYYKIDEIKAIPIQDVCSHYGIVLKIIIIVFEGMKSIIERIGGFFLLLFIIPTIWTLFKKDYYTFSAYIFGIIFVILMQIGAELILSTLTWLYEKIYIYKMELEG